MQKKTKKNPVITILRQTRDFACMKHNQEANNEKEHMDINNNYQNEEFTRGYGR